jgi:uncharacterized membrane protein (UPF0127 family)
VLVNRTTGQVLAARTTVCDTFWSKFLGLMFRRSLDADQALLFCYSRESIAETSIHMFFVPFPIAVIWLNARKEVVDLALAKPFRPYYASRAPAQYFVEGVPGLLEQAQIGDELVFEECARCE